MKILIDTREQNALTGFEDYNTVSCTESIGLKVGDYACEFTDSTRSDTYFERKSLGDLFGTLGKGYPRFRKELERAEKLNYRLILIVEGTITKVLKGHKYSKMKGHSILMKMFTLWRRYNLLPVFCKDRDEMTRFIVEYYNSEGRNK